MNVLDRLRSAFAAATPEGGDPAEFAGAVRPSTDPKFGDYQANGCMALAKAPKKNPREVAAAGRRAVDLDPLADPPEVAGPGFLNVRLRDGWIAGDSAGPAGRRTARHRPPPSEPRTVVIDFSSPNVAKPMHVGHIRSTVIGESLARIFAALGHKVIRDNHLGDWGSQFGMILWGWKNHRDEAAYEADPVAELARLYRLAQERIKAGDAAVEEAARAETAKLHAGDPENRALWERFMPHCLNALQAIYDRLGVRFDVAARRELLRPDARRRRRRPGRPGAWPSRARGRRSSSPRARRPRSSSASATGRSTTPRPTWRRSSTASETWNPDQVLYVVDHRQGDHFKQLFDVARKWGYDDDGPPARRLRHDPRRRPPPVQDPRRGCRRPGVAARRGGRRGAQGRRREQPRPRPGRSSGSVAEVVGLGAIKYADLSQNRLSDYVFDWKKMLAMNGNTGDLSPVRLRPDPEHLPQGGGRRRGRSATPGPRSC